MYLLHAVIHALKLDKADEKKSASVAPASTAITPSADEGAVVAAIAAALHESNK